MTKLIDLSIEKFCEELASKSPAPGGGSASGVAGALGAALISMVANLTINKKKYREVDAKMRELRAEAQALLQEILELIDADTQAFNQVMAAYKMPKQTVAEKQSRSQQIAKATKGATEIPLKVARTCVTTLKLAVIAAEYGNKNALSDAGVAAGMAEASFRGALLNVRINLPGIKDASFKQAVTAEIEQMQQDIKTLSTKVYAMMENM